MAMASTSFGFTLSRESVTRRFSTVAPVLALRVSKRPRLVRRTMTATALCSEACTVIAKATLSLRRSGRPFRARRTQLGLAAGVRGGLKLRFSPEAVRAVRRALARKRPVFAELTVRSLDPAGNATTVERRVRLTR